MSKALAIESNKMDHNDAELDRQAAAAFGERIRVRAAELGLNPADLVRITGIKKQSMTGYWAGKRLCGSDRLFTLSDALHVSARWLVDGVGSRSGDLIDAADAEWVSLPRFDLRQLTDTGKGEPVESVPFRRDWLSRRLLISSGLWLTELPSDYEALDLAEGDAVICSDIAPGTRPEDKWVCVFRGPGGPFVGTYRSRRGEAFAGDDDVISGVELAPLGDIFAIARIHARLLAKL
jgi:transcriptional regulator with XRE-family HTH domain